jgi:ribose 5-phosphate isomerase B
MSITANKIPGIRAALAANEESVELTRRHNDANMLAIGAKFTSPEQAERYVSLFVNTAFEGGRHAQRVAKIAAIERTHSGQERDIES